MNNNNKVTKLRQTKNIFKNLITDRKRIFYAVDKINKKLLNKARKSVYPKGKVFVELYKDLDDKDIYTDEEKILNCLFIPLLLNEEKI